MKRRAEVASACTPAQRLLSLERGTADPARFGHREHLECAWAALEEAPLGQAADRLAAALRRFAGSVGKPDRYHETQTWAFMVLVEERRRARPGLCIGEFFAAWPELLDRGILLRHYGEAELASDRARRAFVLPQPR